MTSSRPRHQPLATAFAFACAFTAVAALGGCTTHPPVASLPASAAREGPAPVAQGDGTKAVRLSLLTYNIAGLPWPERSGTRAAML